MTVLYLSLFLFAVLLFNFCESIVSAASDFGGLPSYAIVTVTKGFLRAEYTDSSTAGSPVFVQAVVVAIGVCYQYQSTAPMHRKLTQVSLDTDKKRATLFYSNFDDNKCDGTAATSFTQINKLTGKVRTTNNVDLKYRWTYEEDLDDALEGADEDENAQDMGNRADSLVKYFGFNSECNGKPYQYRLGTDRCSNYPEFFGRVKCNQQDQVLRFVGYTANNQTQCDSGVTLLKTQPFTCTNQGTNTAISYELARCRKDHNNNKPDTSTPSTTPVTPPPVQSVPSSGQSLPSTTTAQYYGE